MGRMTLNQAVMANLEYCALHSDAVGSDGWKIFVSFVAGRTAKAEGGVPHVVRYAPAVVLDRKSCSGKC